MPVEQKSEASINEANRTRNSFSTYDGSLGAAGYREKRVALRPEDFLGTSGESIALTPGPEGFGEIYVGCAWNVQKRKDNSFIGKMLGRTIEDHVDIDIGCLYELQNGERGALQALGAADGSLTGPPYIRLSHDERSGAADGDDEFMRINGTAWKDIKRIVVYVYIYQGAVNWARVRPQIRLLIPGQQQLAIKPKAHLNDLGVCALALCENVRNGFKLTNLTEYFPGQAELDRAYGFGLEWDDGKKQEIE
jgi:tellurite resistance protein TerA